MEIILIYLNWKLAKLETLNLIDQIFLLGKLVLSIPGATTKNGILPLIPNKEKVSSGEWKLGGGGSSGFQGTGTGKWGLGVDWQLAQPATYPRAETSDTARREPQERGMEGLLLQKQLHFYRGPWALPSNPSPRSDVRSPQPRR